MDKNDKAGARRPSRAALRLIGALAGLGALAATIGIILLFGFSTTINGPSMQPTLETGEKVVMNPLSKGTKAQRFDLVVLPMGPAKVRAVKRLIGLPGDQVRISLTEGAPPKVEVKPAGEQAFRVVVNSAWTSAPAGCCTAQGMQSSEQKAVTVPEGSVWVLGDNLPESEDSRDFGFEHQADIAATVGFRLLPASKFGFIDNKVHFGQ